MAHEQLLTDSELLVGNRLTYASLILFGSRQSLGKFLPQAEIIFEYRSREITCPAQQRLEFREGWFLYEEKLLEAVNLRNENQHFQDGLFVWDIPTFNEAVIREAVLNAFCHRDYRQAGSIFIRQFPRKMEIENPGGFPPGINLDNILQRQAPRNRRIAETLQRCGLVERSGQGVNLMFEKCIMESKSLPDFSGTDTHHVSLMLYGEVKYPQFLRFLEKVGKEKQVSFTTGDLMVLDQIHREGTVSGDLKNYVPPLLEQGLVEKSGRGKYVLSRNFYRFIGRKGVYTRKKGLDRETNKQLLLKHIQDNQKEGSRLGELVEVLPSLTRYQVQKLLQELKSENRVFCIGQTNAGKWFPGKGEVIAPEPDLN